MEIFLLCGTFWLNASVMDPLGIENATSGFPGYLTDPRLYQPVLSVAPLFYIEGKDNQNNSKVLFVDYT